MKKIIRLIFALTILSISSNAQTVSLSPSETAEYCPSQNYTFTVTIPGTNATIVGSSGAGVIQAASNSSSTFTFVGRFNDDNNTQIFTVNYIKTAGGSGSQPFPFKKIKSLFRFGNGVTNNGQTPRSTDDCSAININTNPLQVPICQTNALNISFVKTQYVNIFETPVLCYGAISNYEYLLPAGWKLGTSPSNGSSWLVGSENVTITPDATTGGSLRIRPINTACGTNLLKGRETLIPISRPNPTFTISPSSLQFVCGTAQTKIFTVSTANTISCPVSYIWNLGINNGWIYLGNPAPATFTTTTNSITLTSASANVLPSTVSVTPVLNGNNLTLLSCVTSFTPFTSTATISGLTSFCTILGSSIFTINAGANNTVTWSSTNTGIATVTGGTNSQVTVTTQSEGLFYVNATITNPCGQTVQKTSVPITVGTPLASINEASCITNSAPCSITATQANNYLQLTLNAPLGSYVPSELDWQWEKVSGNYLLYDGGSYTGTSHLGSLVNIYLTGANPTDNPLIIRTRVKNDCGWGAWRSAYWNDGTTTPPPPPPTNYYQINPSLNGGYAANVSLLNPAIVPNTTSPIMVRLYSPYGDLLSTTQMYSNTGTQVYVYAFPYNLMYVNISFDNHQETISTMKHY
jgi:hypothetical protein